MAKLRIPALLVLFSAAGVVEAFRLTSLSSLNNSDIWWHLSSGLWTLQHHSLPHAGIFSQSSTQPWIASSWAYEVLLAIAYKLLGLGTIPWLLMSFRAALAILTFLLAGGRRGRFWLAVGLSVLTQYILAPAQPGPAYVSTLFWGLELLLLLNARRSGNSRPLWSLPVLFLLWANLHVQFIYGVVVLVLFLGAVTIEKSLNISSTLNVGQAGAIIAASIVATLATPYLFGPYAVFFKTTFSSANRYLPDFQALGFRQPQDYLLLLLAMSAFLALGLRRSRDLFQIAVLAFSLGISLYSRRDIWMVALASLSVIEEATAIGEKFGAEQREKSARDLWTALGASLAILVIVFLLRVPRNREALLAKVRETYPVAACEYIRQHGLPQPLFNAYEWGGFLTWYLPEYPVAIDSRTDLYGTDAITEYSKVMNAELPFTGYQVLAEAEIILLPKRAMMGIALSSVPRFKVEYSDDVAVVLTPRAMP
ncbi:MAG TPA: hypothetical protein VMP68_13125 [Candidatus Eisenbacteria bacterium]|nr:hypothetical protein [Candidatus Eisenbacteria bacterium]